MYQQGNVAWGLSRSVMFAVAVAAAAAVLALVTYRGLAAANRTRDRVILIGLRLAALAVLVVCLFRPTLILKAAVPQQNFLGVLIDDSRSMAIADRNGETRSAFIQQQLSGPNAKLYAELSKRFVIRLFSFSSSATRVPSTNELKYGGAGTPGGPRPHGSPRRTAGLPPARPRV